MNTCAICQRNRSTFSINIPIEDSNEFEIKHVCGSCVDIISSIAANNMMSLEARLTRLEVFTGMTAPAPLPDALVTFHAGDAGYSDSPETPQLDENGDLRF